MWYSWEALSSTVCFLHWIVPPSNLFVTQDVNGTKDQLVRRLENAAKGECLCKIMKCSCFTVRFVSGYFACMYFYLRLIRLVLLALIRIDNEIYAPMALFYLHVFHCRLHRVMLGVMMPLALVESPVPIPTNSTSTTEREWKHIVGTSLLPLIETSHPPSQLANRDFPPTIATS